MYKLLGVILLVAGTTGFSFCICTERQRRLVLLKEIKHMYGLMCSEIRYSALPLPEVFEVVAEKIQEPFRAMLKTISEKLDWEKGETLCSIWENEVYRKLFQLPLSAGEKEGFLRFPECMGLPERGGQAKAIERLMEDLDEQIGELSREIKVKNKMIMSLGISAGLLMAIVLL